ncbi:hypothetical protein PGT21_003967 [Puccinia graminis f. sp. tritici]|uniref:RING-type domain-containing protein n=1 Tax=Puccinia graminis f. sp. tritici TaxID=56615 RepID=A0A5B0QST4_PUCGR|nr:hypothetical protein PGT21_003967 [Puccinia graminis f. sp. tritici]
MLLVFSILVTMLLQVIVLGTPTIHAADQIGLPIPVGPKSLLKPVHQHTKRMDLVENNQYSSEMCTICQDELGAKSYRWPTCQHLFHFRCIDEWRRCTEAPHAECPNCKSTDSPLAGQQNPQNNSQGGESSVSNLSDFRLEDQEKHYKLMYINHASCCWPTSNRDWEDSAYLFTVSSLCDIKAIITVRDLIKLSVNRINWR